LLAMLLVSGMLTVLAKWSGLGKYVDEDAPWRGAVLVGLVPAALLAVPGLWGAWHFFIEIIMKGFEGVVVRETGAAPVLWPSRFVALVSAAVVLSLVGALKLSAFVAPERRGEWRLAVWWVLGGLFAWAFWTNTDNFRPVTPAGLAGVGSALCLALGVGAWRRETLRALSRGRSWLAVLLEAAMVLCLAYFFVHSLLAILVLSSGLFFPGGWWLAQWIGSGIGPFVVIALLKRWFGLAPSPSSQGDANVNDKAALALWRARRRGG